MSDTCDKIGHGPVDTSGFDAVKKSDCAVCQIEAKDQRIAELEAELQTAWNACDAAEVKGRHVEAVLNQLKSAIAASEDTRK